jgi:hypothetical protein
MMGGTVIDTSENRQNIISQHAGKIYRFLLLFLPLSSVDSCGGRDVASVVRGNLLLKTIESTSNSWVLS